jgi:hypothetical protein
MRFASSLTAALLLTLTVSGCVCPDCPPVAIGPDPSGGSHAVPSQDRAPMSGGHLVADAPALAGSALQPLAPDVRPVVSLRVACPGTAICWACLAPGAGHFYTGETGRGALLAGTAAGSLLAGTLLSSGGGTCRATNPEDQGRCTYDHENHRMVEPTNRTPLYVGAAVAAAGWIYGIVDAGSSARRMNASSGVAVGPFDAQPQPGVRTTAAGEPALGIGVRLTW